MEQGQERSMIAWFKLAECVSLKQRERAFTFYRLLSYSITDPALVAQLQGELHEAFGENSQALLPYHQALSVYHAAGNFLSAAQIAERILLCSPTEQSFEQLFVLMQEIKNKLGYELYTAVYVKGLIESVRAEQLVNFLLSEDVSAFTPLYTSYERATRFLIEVSQETALLEQLILAVLERLEFAEQRLTNRYLTLLKTISPEWYTFACTALQKE